MCVVAAGECSEDDDESSTGEAQPLDGDILKSTSASGRLMESRNNAKLGLPRGLSSSWPYLVSHQ